MTTEAETAAVARALTKRYANGVVALNHIDLEIGRAKITALIGNNGSGKTTFLKVLAGLLTPDSGSAQTLGCDPSTRPAWLRARIGYVSQAVELDPEMTASETLSLFATLYGLPPAKCHARIASIAGSFALPDHLPQMVSTLSGGLRQRLHLALGILHEPELMLLDEPTAALDPAGRSFVWHFLQRLRNEGRTIVVVSHDLAEVSQHCQALALFHKGRLLATGSPAGVIAAQANWTLEVEFAGSAEQYTTVLHQLTSPSGVKCVSADGQRLVAQFARCETSVVQQVTQAILQQLARLEAAVLGYRLHPPDLVSAYFNLTGAALEEAEQSSRIASGKGSGGRYPQGQETAV